MKVCDRHNNVNAAYTFDNGGGIKFDLCNACVMDLTTWVGSTEESGPTHVEQERVEETTPNSKPKRGRKRNNKK